MAHCSRAPVRPEAWLPAREPLWQQGAMLRIFLAILVMAMMSPADAQNRDQALIVAAGKGDVAAVERLIREGASVAARDGRGRTAFLAATHGNHAAVAR